MTLGLDPWEDPPMGSRRRGGGPCVVCQPPTPEGGIWGDGDCLEGGAPPFFLGAPPKSYTGDDGFGSWWRTEGGVTKW